MMTLMETVLSTSERDRRWQALSDGMGRSGYDALVFVSNDYNGHKGALRYVADHRVFGFPCYAVMIKDQEPVVVLASGMRGIRRGWCSDYRFARSMIEEVASIAQEAPSLERVGVVGLSHVMRVEEYQRLSELLAGTELVDASDLFEDVRSAKSAEEVRGAEEAMAIADGCLDRLLEITRPGLTKRSLAAEVLKVCAERGGNDPILLTLDNISRTGEERTRWSPPSDDVISPAELLMFSIELIGPSGYWVELCRMVAISEPTEEMTAIHKTVRGAMESAGSALKGGAKTTAVQREVMDAAEDADTRVAYWIGHGIGQDVIEQPLLGFDIVEDQAQADRSAPEISESMIFAVHPLLVPNGPSLAGYMADTYIAGSQHARRLSRHSLDLVRLP